MIDVKKKENTRSKDFRPENREEIPGNKEGQNFARKCFGQPAVVEGADLVKDSSFIHRSFGHQTTEVGMKIDPVPERPDDGDDTGLELSSPDGLEIEKKRVDGRPAELAQKLFLA